MDATTGGPGGARQLAALAGLLADPTRAAVCLALLDRRAWTAGELAGHCGVTRSTMSEQLTRLVDGGLLVEQRQGRHRYVRLADVRVARMVEDLIAHAGPPATPPRGLRAHIAGTAMARGRTCYDHLAGRLGVAITDAMTSNGLLRQDTGFALTDAGADWLAGLGADLTGSRTSRPVARPCLDWTERRNHLAGIAGAELCRLLLAHQWVVRVGRQRAVKATDSGVTQLHRTLGITSTDLELPSAPTTG